MCFESVWCGKACEAECECICIFVLNMYVSDYVDVLFVHEFWKVPNRSITHASSSFLFFGGGGGWGLRFSLGAGGFAQIWLRFLLFRFWLSSFPCSPPLGGSRLNKTCQKRTREIVDASAFQPVHSIALLDGFRGC